jgi:hypothetical protein
VVYLLRILANTGVRLDDALLALLACLETNSFLRLNLGDALVALSDAAP